MVSRDKDLMSMRQFRQPGHKLLYLASRASIAKVAGVDQDVSVGDFDLAMKSVGVGDADDSHPVGFSSGSSRSRSSNSPREKVRNPRN